MSQVLTRLSKASPLRGFRMFSSSSVTGPFLRLGSMVKVDKDVPDDILLFDAAKEEYLTVPETPLPQELADTTVVESSHGWGFFSCFSDRSLYISDHLNPLSSSSKVIPLPPLTALSSCQTDVFCNVAMSSSFPSDDDQDLVLAVKFLGRQLSLCRPNRDLRWTNIATPFPVLERSNLMYSNRDRKFYLPLPGSTYLYSWDLHFTPGFRNFVYANRPKLSQSEHELLDSCSRADHWVESPSGERFLVKCYANDTLERDPVFMVFREEEMTDGETFNMHYTEDIGDLCIFISQTDPFCVQASSCPGLVPNSIYLVESFFGVYHLPTKSLRPFEENLEMSDVQPILPHWLPPISI
ncbi:unnamed protein product [Brassica oleracea var. botrytis]